MADWVVNMRKTKLLYDFQNDILLHQGKIQDFTVAWFRDPLVYVDRATI